MGSVAPFHSQIQNKMQTRIPEKRVARTAADFHGKVTPP
jgi:hypothetical protein